MGSTEKISEAAKSIKEGGFAIVYDGNEREGEADLMFHPAFASPEKIEKLRKDAGGLICLAIGKNDAERMGLGFMTDALRKAGYADIICKRTAYGDEPAFSLAVNHRNVFTGITDKDRALTILEMAKMIMGNLGASEFIREFYAPGHVFLLIGRGLENRKGHTELGLELAKKAGMSEAIVMCEMLGNGPALGRKEVEEYAKRNGIPFLEGIDLYA